MKNRYIHKTINNINNLNTIKVQLTKINNIKTMNIKSELKPIEMIKNRANFHNQKEEFSQNILKNNNNQTKDHSPLLIKTILTRKIIIILNTFNNQKNSIRIKI